MRHLTSVVAVALLVAACGSESQSQTGPTPPPAPTPTGGHFFLSGIVTDSSTGAALAGATVAIDEGPNAGRSATTDSAGRYNFVPDLVSSRFTIRVTREGYAETTQSVQLNTNTTLNVALDRTLTGSWRGTVSFTFNGQRATSGLSNAQLTQTGTQLTGLLTAESGVSGSLNGTADGGRFSGTLRIDLEPNGRCTGIASVTGPTTSTSVTLSSPVLSLENCTGNVRDIELRLTR